LAQIGSRLIDGTSRKMASDFFERFATTVAPAVAAEKAPEAAPAEPPPEAAKPKDLRLSPVLWVTGLAAIVGAMLYFFTGRRVTR
jgi:hypothetical protein